MDIARLLDVFFNLSVAQEYLPALLKGAWITVSLAAVVVVCGLAIGLVLALIRLISPHWIVEVLRLWVDCMRALPPLALLLLMYFGLPSIGVNLSATWVLGLVLTAILAAFAEEIFWAGITAIPKGQWEAARSSGLTQGGTLRWVVLPQAMKICLPPLTNRTIGITKNTALGTAIGMPELLNEAQTAQAFSGNATPLIMAAVGYLFIFIPLTVIAGRIERRMAWGRKA